MKYAATNGVWFPVIFIIGFGVIYLPIIKSAEPGQVWVVVFAVVLPIVMLSMAWLELFRTAHRIDVIGDSLVEHRMFRKRVIPIADIVSITEPRRFPLLELGQANVPRPVVIRLAAGQSIRVQQRDGFTEFLADLQRVNNSISDERAHPPRNDHAARYWPLTIAESTKSKQLIAAAESPTSGLGNQASEANSSGS